MFRPGVAEAVTLAVDALIASLVLSRRGFHALRILGAWLLCTAGALALLVILIGFALAALETKTAGVVLVPVGVAAVLVLLVTRTLVARRLSTSSVFSRTPGTPLGWGWAALLSAGALATAMLAGGLVSAILASP